MKYPFMGLPFGDGCVGFHRKPAGIPAHFRHAAQPLGSASQITVSNEGSLNAALGCAGGFFIQAVNQKEAA